MSGVVGDVACGPGMVLDQTMLTCVFEFSTSKTVVVIAPSVCKAWSGAALAFSPEDLNFAHEPPWGRCISDQALLRCVIPRIGQSVRSVYLSNCGRISDNGLYMVAAAFPSLRALEVRHCRQISHIGLMRVTSVCRWLEKLHLPTYVADSELRAIAASEPNLVEVDASGLGEGRDPGVTDIGVAALARVSGKLQSLNLKNQWKLTAVSLQAIGQHCPNLTKLSLANTGMNSPPNDINTGMLSLQRCAKLVILNLGGLLSLSDSSLQVVSSGCPLLQELQLLKCVEVSDTGLQHIGDGCHMIRKIGLDFLSKLTDVGLRSLAAGCRRLQVIELPTHWSSSQSPITESGVAAMLRMCDLLHLDNVQGGVQKSDAVVAEFAMAHPELKALKRDIKLSDAGLNRLSVACPLIQELALTNCNVSDHALAQLGDRCPQLQKIQLMRCRLISERSIVHLLECCTNLQPQGIFVDNNILGDRYLQTLGTQRPKIRSLFIVSNIVTDQGIEMLSSGCFELETVALHCEQITDAGVAHLVRNARNLKRLSIELCHITDFSLGLVAASSGELQELSLHAKADGISKNGLQMLARTCKQLRKLYFLQDEKLLVYKDFHGMQPRIQGLVLNRSADWVRTDSFPEHKIDRIAEF